MAQETVAPGGGSNRGGGYPFLPVNGSRMVKMRDRLTPGHSLGVARRIGWTVVPLYPSEVQRLRSWLVRLQVWSSSTGQPLARRSSPYSETQQGICAVDDGADQASDMGDFRPGSTLRFYTAGKFVKMLQKSMYTTQLLNCSSDVLFFLGCELRS